jgi:N-dimethylarginine dimethylaminohydrolase
MPPRVLMCRPDHYGIEYEINPWMSRARPADRKLAIEQWQALLRHIESTGATIELVSPIAGLPDLVFTANAAMIFGSRAILAHFKHHERQGEEPFYEAALQKLGFEVSKSPPNAYFEGAGDALFCGDTLFCGYQTRSDARGHQQIGDLLGLRVIPLEMIDWYYYHLDTCFCPLAEGEAIYFAGAFDEYGLRALREAIPNLIEVNEIEAKSFACNAVVVGKTVITNTGCDDLHEKLRCYGYTPISTPLSEFVKAGGSAKCLTLRLDGEEAAAWKHQRAASA